MGFDVVLSLSFWILFAFLLDACQLSHNLLLLRDSTHRLLIQLIDWLMGVPAGLKLNRQLSHFLGNFFISHINIWIGYLQVLQLYSPPVLEVIALTSYMGLSLIGALTNDVISILTCHIYCFYVYAAKLYALQLKCLISLARLFVGKKWNVLRLRVDSVTYEADQLILGTIMFTILLFLLPTSLLYYIVFAGLRLFVVVVQVILDTLVRVFSFFPVYGLLVRLMSSVCDLYRNNSVTTFKADYVNGMRDQRNTLDSFSSLFSQCFEEVDGIDVVVIVKNLC